MDLLDQLETIPSEFTNDKAITSLLAHQTHLSTKDVSLIDVTGQQNDKYLGDFWGLLDDLSIPKKFHWAVAMLNGVRDSSAYTGNLDAIVMPTLNEIEAIVAIER